MDGSRHLRSRRSGRDARTLRRGRRAYRLPLPHGTCGSAMPGSTLCEHRQYVHQCRSTRVRRGADRRRGSLLLAYAEIRPAGALSSFHRHAGDYTSEAEHTRFGYEHVRRRKNFSTTVRQYPHTPAESIGRLTRWLNQTMVRCSNWQGPSDYGVERNVPVPTRDGVRLRPTITPHRHFIPGTVLMRGPDGRGLRADLLEARLLAGQGYHVVNESRRGMFAQVGSLSRSRVSTKHAEDTVAWPREQEWFDGWFVTDGASDLGLGPSGPCSPTRPPESRTAVVSLGFDDFADFAWAVGLLLSTTC